MNHACKFAAMTILIRKTLLPLLLLTGIMACNQGEKEDKQVITDPAGAEKQLRSAVTNHPDSLLLREKLIQYYRENGEYEQALAASDELLKKDSLNARFWDISATLYFENADTLKAIHAFEKAVSILPEPEYLMSLGSLYAQTKNPKALAVAGLLARAAGGKTEKEALFIEGLYHSYTGEKEKAISFFDQCLKMEYTFMPAYLEKGIALYDQSKYEEAIGVLGRAVTLQNNFAEGYYWQGRCFEKLNKSAGAAEAYHTALLYDPEYAEAKDGLSRLGVK